MLRLALALLTALPVAATAATTHAAEATLKSYQRVAIAPAKTSVYVGTVSLTMPALERSNALYQTTYVAKVFPYFFYNEKGRLTIELTDDLLRQLARGEPIDFTGQAVREDGAERRIEGKATPIDASTGKLKVRVFYSKRVELIFNTTYRFPGWQLRPLRPAEF